VGRAIIYENINGEGYHLPRTHNPVGEAMRKSHNQFRQKDRKIMSLPNSNIRASRPRPRGYGHTRVPKLKGTVPSPTVRRGGEDPSSSFGIRSRRRQTHLTGVNAPPSPQAGPSGGGGQTQPDPLPRTPPHTRTHTLPSLIWRRRLLIRLRPLAKASPVGLGLVKQGDVIRGGGFEAVPHLPGLGV
jgi:hypothetical protein